MGDLSDMNDISRFMRCEAGRKKLAEIRAMFESKTVVKVEFENEIHAVSVTFQLNSGECVKVFLPELELDVLREEMGDAILVEYYKDYPERRPKEGGPDE